jgi:hypothetical protein
VVDTSIIAALKIYDPAELPDTMLITAVTLGELSFGPHATDDPAKRVVEEYAIPEHSGKDRRGCAGASAGRTGAPVRIRCAAAATAR